ncbi:MAG: hypothetical protein H3C35_13880 [Bacteroidetes bacterium]|nr:hypothetical protein [Bacteroidota bacterium]
MTESEIQKLVRTYEENLRSFAEKNRSEKPNLYQWEVELVKTCQSSNAEFAKTAARYVGAGATLKKTAKNAAQN